MHIICKSTCSGLLNSHAVCYFQEQEFMSSKAGEKGGIGLAVCQFSSSFCMKVSRQLDVLDHYCAICATHLLHAASLCTNADISQTKKLLFFLSFPLLLQHQCMLTNIKLIRNLWLHLGFSSMYTRLSTSLCILRHKEASVYTQGENNGGFLCLLNWEKWSEG